MATCLFNPVAIHEIDLALMDVVAFLLFAWMPWAIGCKGTPSQAACFAFNIGELSVPIAGKATLFISKKISANSCA